MLFLVNLSAVLILFSGFITPAMAGSVLSSMPKRTAFDIALEQALKPRPNDKYRSALDVTFELFPHRSFPHFKEYRIRYSCQLWTKVNLDALHRVFDAIVEHEHAEYNAIISAPNYLIDLTGKDHLRGQSLKGLEDIALNMCLSFPAEHRHLSRQNAQLVQSQSKKPNSGPDSPEKSPKTLSQREYPDMDSLSVWDQIKYPEMPSSDE